MALTAGSTSAILLAEASTRSSGDTSFFLRRVTASTAVIFQSSSRAIEILLPQVEIDGIRRIGGLAPQRPRGETHGVEVLRVLALELRVRIGKDVRTMVPLDDAQLAAHIARQAGMAGRVQLAGAHRLAWREARARRHLALGRTALQEGRHHLVGGEWRRGHRQRRIAPAGLE